MEKHAEDARRKAMVIDIDMLVPKDHLLRKIERSWTTTGCMSG